MNSIRLSSICSVFIANILHVFTAFAFTGGVLVKKILGKTTKDQEKSLQVVWLARSVLINNLNIYKALMGDFPTLGGSRLTG